MTALLMVLVIVPWMSLVTLRFLRIVQVTVYVKMGGVLLLWIATMSVLSVEIVVPLCHKTTVQYSIQPFTLYR